MRHIRKFKLSVWQYLAIGYLVVILLGSILLSLPFATENGTPTVYIDAIFTAVSATCVTGLIPVDTATHWNAFGEIVILLMIQLGGLGFMTIVATLFRIVGRNMGQYERRALMLSAGEEERNDLRRLLSRIIIGTLIFELAGAAILSIRFIQDFGFGKGIYYSIWHSISAFCNAGFDLMGGVFDGAKFVSLTHYAADPIVSLTISFLIIFGGIGFCLWDDVVETRCNVKKFRLQTKVVLWVTAIILLVSTLLFLFFERNNTAFGDTFGEKLLSCFFAAVTPRTAGFNTIDFANYSDSSFFLTVILMFIGGGSGSTAGGIKITTFAVIVMGMISVFRGKRDIEIGKRRVHSALLRQALAIAVAFLTIATVSTLIVCSLEQNNPTLLGAPFKAVLFEVFSAIGTVGLSMSLTPTLTVASKIILMLLMYLGRVGVLTLAFAFGEQKQTAEIKKPVDTLLIG